MTIQTKAQKWGGSVSAPIPSAIARKLHIKAGSPLQVEERDGSVLVTPVRRRRPLSEILKSCRKKFPKGNPHGTVDFGPPVGKEIW
jgi:antitoxin MazE